MKLECHGAKIYSDGGLLLLRELDEVLGLTNFAGIFLQDSRSGANIRHTMTALLHQAVFGRRAGIEDTNDTERLRTDPTMRQIRGGCAKANLAAPTSQMSRFETEILSRDANVQALADLNGKWNMEANRHFMAKDLILDMDSSESRSVATRKVLPVLVILQAHAIIRLSELCRKRAICIVLAIGEPCWSLWWLTIDLP